jgi:hypothetical protein
MNKRQAKKELSKEFLLCPSSYTLTRKYRKNARMGLNKEKFGMRKYLRIVDK